MGPSLLAEDTRDTKDELSAGGRVTAGGGLEASIEDTQTHEWMGWCFFLVCGRRESMLEKTCCWNICRWK